MPLNILVVIAIVLIGLILLLLEFFLLPGFGIAGIGGLLLLGGGVFFAYTYIGSTAGTITLATSLVLLTISFIWLIKSKSLRKIALTTDITESVDNSDLKKLNKGEVGTTLSRLNPIGKVLFGDIIVEGKSFDGELIDEETEVEIVRIDTYNVAVRPKTADPLITTSFK